MLQELMANIVVMLCLIYKILLLIFKIMLFYLQAIEQPGETSDDFQEIGTADKEVLNRKFSMDDAVEDKICDLYDLYIQVLFIKF